MTSSIISLISGKPHPQVLFCFHGATPPFVPKTWARRIPIPSAGHMADDPKAGRQGLLLQKHTAVSTLNRTFITKRQKQPGLVAGPNRAATVPAETRLLPATLLGTRKRDVGGVQKSPSICSAICRPRIPGSCCKGKQRAPVCGAAQSWIPGRDHSRILALGRLVPCRRPRIPQDTPSALCDAHRDADSRHWCGIDGSRCSEPGIPAHPRCLRCLYGPLLLPSIRGHDLLQILPFPRPFHQILLLSALCTCPSTLLSQPLGSLCLRGVRTSLTNCSFTGRCSLQFFPLLTVPSLESLHE